MEGRCGSRPEILGLGQYVTRIAADSHCRTGVARAREPSGPRPILELLSEQQQRRLRSLRQPDDGRPERLGKTAHAEPGQQRHHDGELRDGYRLDRHRRLGRPLHPEVDRHEPRPGSITYSSSKIIEQGSIYMTNVTINGAGGQPVAVAQVPVLQVLTSCPTSNPNCGTVASNVSFMGVGFNRGGFSDPTSPPQCSAMGPVLSPQAHVNAPMRRAIAYGDLRRLDRSAPRIPRGKLHAERRPSLHDQRPIAEKVSPRGPSGLGRDDGTSSAFAICDSPGREAAERDPERDV